MRKKSGWEFRVEYCSSYGSEIVEVFNFIILKDSSSTTPILVVQTGTRPVPMCPEIVTAESSLWRTAKAIV